MYSKGFLDLEWTGTLWNKGVFVVWEVLTKFLTLLIRETLAASSFEGKEES